MGELVRIFLVNTGERQRGEATGRGLVE